MTEIRLFRQKDVDTSWEEIPVEAYIPLVLGGGATDLNKQNVEKRIRMNYFKHDPSIVKVRWNIQGEDEGFWIEP